MIKYILAILLLCSTVSASVKNTGTTRRDSVSIYVVCLDSTGKPSTCDSFYVRVANNSSNAVLFSDSGTLTMTGMDSISGKSEYYYHRLVADIDGGGTDGEYILWVNAKKTAGSGWTTPNSRIFQIQNILYADSAIFQRLGVYNTTASTTTNDYGAVEFSTTGDSSFAFVVKNTGISGAKFKGSAFKLYSKTHSGILSIGGATGSPVSGGLFLLDSSSGGYGLYSRSIASGYGGIFVDDIGGLSNTIGPFGGDISANVFNATHFFGTVASEFASAIMKDTTKRIGVKGGLGDSVLTPTPSVSASVTSLPDSVQSNIARHVWDRTADTTYPNKSWGDTVGKAALTVVTKLDSATSKVGIGDNAIGSGELAASANQEIDSGVWHSRVDTITPDSSAGKIIYKNKKIKDTVSLFVDVATSSRGTSTLTATDNIGINLSDVSGTLDSNEVGQSTYDVIDKNVVSRMFDDTTKKVKFSNDSVVAIDPIRTVTAMVAGGATAAALSTAQDSLNALTAITRADSNLTKAVRDTAHIIDSIVKLILPIVTQSRDSLLSVPTWLAARFDTMMVAAGWADSSRTTNTYLNDADTVRVYKGESLWFKYLRLHPAHVPGYRPDSTRGRGW